MSIPLSILHTVEFYYPHLGGAETVVQKISEQLVQRGHRVTVATTRFKERQNLELNGVKIREFSIRGKQATGFQAKNGEIALYRDFILNSDFQIMMNYAAQQWATDLVFDVLKEIQKKRVNIIAPCGYSALKTATELRYAEFDRYFQDILPEVIPLYDAAIYHSGMYKDYEYADNHGFSNSVIIQNGVGKDEFMKPPVIDFRKKYGIHTTYMGLCVANYFAGKGQDRVIDCVKQMDRKDFTMVFIGKEGEELNRLQAQAKRLKIRFFIDIPREETLAAYHAADIFLFGSYVEASPLVILEAKASKTPFVSTDCGNVCEWKGGIVCKDAKMAGHANVILDNEAIRKQLVEDGHQEWKEKYTWESIVDKYERLYLDLDNKKVIK